MDDMTLQSLMTLFWPDADADLGPGRQVHWLLDGARDPEIASLVRSSGLDYTCLYSGALHPRLAAAAPYLVQLNPAAPATARLLRRGWGQAWGIFTIGAAPATLDRQRLHFKKFLRVQTADGKLLAFRYYDPRVLNIYLPTCTNDEVRTLLGPVARLISESDAGTHALDFRLEGGAMTRRAVLLQEADHAHYPA